MTPRFGVGILPELNEEILQTASLAEDLGYDNLWIADHCQYDIFSILTLIAGRTNRVKLGTAVTNVYTRHPAIIAAAIATINEISGGRAVLGIGASAGQVLRKQFFPPENPVLHCKEAVEVIKRLCAGNAVSYRGRTVRLENYRLHLKATKVPIYLAARGPRMLELAGELADGVIINGLGAWPPALKSSLRYVEKGARRVGRDLNELDVVCWTRAAIGENPEPLMDLIRPVIGVKLADVPDQILEEKYAVGSDLANRIKERFKSVKDLWDPIRGRPLPDGSIADLIPDSLLEKFCLSGTPEQVVRRVKEILQAGATQIALLNWPQYDRPEDLSNLRISTIKMFAERVIPSLRE